MSKKQEYAQQGDENKVMLFCGQLYCQSLTNPALSSCYQCMLHFFSASDNNANEAVRL